jgi:hypothetical protein
LLRRIASFASTDVVPTSIQEMHMKRLSFVALTALLVAAPWMATPSTAAPLGSGFTYQGDLELGGTPISVATDFEFSLWDDAGTGCPPTGGTQLGATQTVGSVTVTDGRFTVILNAGAEFGSNPFDGSARWLQIAVRSPAGGGAFTTLCPRQPITATPYALRMRLPFDGTTSAGVPGLKVTNTGGGEGLSGVSTSNNGVSGRNSTSNNFGLLGHPEVGVYGQHGTSGDYGGIGYSDFGAYGVNGGTGSFGYLGNGDWGVEGNGIGAGAFAFGIGVYGHSSDNFGIGVYGWAPGGPDAYAGYFDGRARVTGNFTSGNKFFRIDHPLDPEAKYLQHSCVESDEMKNVYDGVVTLDGNGEAWVDLPRWFESLNRDFRYQLTCIGGFAPVYVARTVQGNRFQIAGGKGGLKVSWQVTGVRQDALAKAMPLLVEVEKGNHERGRYQNPEAFGLPATRGIFHERVHAARAAVPPKPPVR